MEQTVGTIPAHVQAQAGRYEDAATRWAKRDPDHFHPDMKRAGEEMIEAARWLTVWFEARVDEIGQQVAAYDRAGKGVV